mgnify:CR=1 FL=1
MKKTPLQQLIEQLEIESGFYNENDHVHDRMYKLGIEYSIEKANALLEEEKEQICDFADDYQRNCFQKSAHEYFNETYQTN